MNWKPIETCPKGYDKETGLHYVLFYGTSKAQSFNHPVFVSGWMDRDGKPVYFYQYKLIITHWMPLPNPPNAKS